MSETLWAVIVGGLLTGGVALGVQVLEPLRMDPFAHFRQFGL